MKRSPRQSVDPCWFYTSTADQVYYYFLAILSMTTELKPLYSEYVELVRGRKSTEDLEAGLLRSLKTDRDLLIHTASTRPARGTKLPLKTPSPATPELSTPPTSHSAEEPTETSSSPNS